MPCTSRLRLTTEDKHRIHSGDISPCGCPHEESPAEQSHKISRRTSGWGMSSLTTKCGLDRRRRFRDILLLPFLHRTLEKPHIHDVACTSASIQFRTTITSSQDGTPIVSSGTSDVARKRQLATDFFQERKYSSMGETQRYSVSTNND